MPFFIDVNLSEKILDPAADSIEQKILQMEKSRDKPDFGHGSYVEDKYAQSDNINISGPPIAAGWVVLNDDVVVAVVSVFVGKGVSSQVLGPCIISNFSTLFHLHDISSTLTFSKIQMRIFY